MGWVMLENVQFRVFWAYLGIYQCTIIYQLDPTTVTISICVAIAMLSIMRFLNSSKIIAALACIVLEQMVSKLLTRRAHFLRKIGHLYNGGVILACVGIYQCT